jgi:hypothetical protein
MGTAATIARMRDFVTEYKRNFEIRKLAAKIIANCPAKDYYCYAKALYEFCRDRIKYVYDPHMVELVESPTKILESGVADCDSVCTLLASLNESIGLKTRFRTVKADVKRPDDFSHVYCVVRVPTSRFSTSTVSGWIPEDATLPDKQFGWEPKGPQILGYKDWAASKDKDGEDEAGIGGLAMMNAPMSETEAQLEIDRLTNDLNQRMVGVLRKGIEYSDPNKAQVIMYGVSSVTRQAVLPVAPLQKLASVRNGYNHWSNVISQTYGEIPDLVGAPMMSGYAPMGGIWDWLTGGPTTPVMTPNEQAISRMNAYIAQISDRISRLKDGGANAYYPTQMQQLGNYLSDMRQTAAYGSSDAQVREPAVQKTYKVAVTLAENVATNMYDIGKRVDQPASLQTMQAKSWWDTTKETVANLPLWAKTVVSPAYALVSEPGQQGAAPPTYPEQQNVVTKKPTADTTQTYTPSKPYVPKKTPGMPDEGLVVPGEADSTEEWLKKNGLWLGLGAVALVGAYLYFKKPVAIAANPRRKRGRSRNPHVPFNVYLKGKLIDTVFYSDTRTTADYVKRGLINHDGYDPGIRVVKCHGKRKR